MCSFLLQGHQDHRLQARARVYLSVIIRFYCGHFDISCKSEKYQFCGNYVMEQWRDKWTQRDKSFLAFANSDPSNVSE